MGPVGNKILSQALAVYPDYQEAQIALEFILNAFPEESAKALAKDNMAAQGLISLCSASPPLARMLARDPAATVLLFKQGEIFQPKDRAAMDAELEVHVREAESLVDLQKEIRRYRHAAMARIAVRDLCGLASLDEVMRELSDLAAAALGQTCEWCFQNLAQKYGCPGELDCKGDKTGFAVIGMGKLGGHELNFCSDIDLIYIYKIPPRQQEMTSGGSAAPVHFHDFYTRLAEMVTDVLHRVTEDGIAFRVDLNLRPGGKESPIAHSLDAAEIFYTIYGETWHRLSLIKASFAAGDAEVAESFLKMVRPFVYRRYLDYGSLEEIRWLKRRVESAAGKESGLDIKRGRGGIRELEFLVQTLQIINGGRFPKIRETSTLGALEELSRTGFIEYSTKFQLEEAYRFLRQLEHRIQMVQMRQTHRLPDEEEAVARLAHGLGYSSANKLKEVLRQHCEIVHEHFSRLMGEKDSPGSERHLAERLLSGSMDDAEVMDALTTMGFNNVPAAMEAIKSLTGIHATSRLHERSRKLLKGLAPALLSQVSAAPDPDMALMNLDRWIHRVVHRWGVHALLAENPIVAGSLTRLFGSSNFLSRMFINHPQLAEQLILQDENANWKSRREMEEDLSRELQEEENPEEKLAILRRYQNEEILLIGMQYVFDKLSVEEVSHYLTRLAEVCIDRSLSLAIESIDAWNGGSRDSKPPFVVMGMGRLGGEELNFNSDLDLLFVYETPENLQSAGEVAKFGYFVRLAQRFISLLSVPTVHGLGYRVDMRLRPSGTVGPLVVSLESFRDYYRNEARLWERQALIRTRVVAGHPGFGDRVLREVHRFAYKEPLHPEAAREMRRMRNRMEIELARETEGSFNIKTGLGGLVDVEFGVQYLQLKYGGEHPRLREPNTFKAIKAMGEEGILTGNDLQDLMDGYDYLRRVETHLRLLHDFSTDKLRFDSDAAKRIARGLGYKAEQETTAVEAMREEYERVTKNVREVYERILN